MSSFRKNSLSADENASSSATKATNNLVVRIDQDSDDNLQELFDSVLNPGDSKRPLQVPFRMRKLPNSFFNPPAATARSPSISHSRANSADSAYDAGSQSNVNQATVNATTAGGSQVNIVAAAAAADAVTVAATNTPTATTAAANNNNNNSNNNNNNNSNATIDPPKLAICHARAHSSPASLQQTYNMHSSNVGAAGNSAAAAAVNEADATVGSTGTAFGNNGTTATAAGFSLGLERLNQCLAQQSANNPIPTFHMKQRSYDVISPIALQSELGALPPGWEQAKTNDGQIYYLK